MVFHIFFQSVQQRRFFFFGDSSLCFFVLPLSFCNHCVKPFFIPLQLLFRKRMAAFTDLFIPCMVHFAKKHAHVLDPGISGLFCIFKKRPLQMNIAFLVTCTEMVYCRFGVRDECTGILLKDFDSAKRFKVFFGTAAVKHMVLCAKISYICLSGSRLLSQRLHLYILHWNWVWHSQSQPSDLHRHLQSCGRNYRCCQ